MSPRHNNAHHTSHRGLRVTSNGFTLVEVLIALSLTVMLLGIVWNSISTYRELQQKVDRRAMELRLVRSLMAQLRDDFLSAHHGGAPEGAHLQLAVAQATPLDSPSSTSPHSPEPSRVGSLPATDSVTDVNADKPPATSRQGPDPNAGLRGGSTWIVLDISLPTTTAFEPSTSQSLAQPTATAPEVRQWQRIAYFFAAPTPSGTLAGAVSFPSGLHRISTMPADRFDSESFIAAVQSVGQVATASLDAAASVSEEIAPSGTDPSIFDSPLETTGLTAIPTYDPRMWLRNNQLALPSTATPLASPSTPTVSDRANEFASPTMDASLGMNPVAATEVKSEAIPEIGWCRFRYFDGKGWQDAWDSRQKKSLPVAISFAYVLVDDIAKAAAAQSTSDTIPDVNAQMAASLADDLAPTTLNAVPLSEPLTITLPAPNETLSSSADEINSPAMLLSDDTLAGNLLEVPIRQSVFTVAGATAPAPQRPAAAATSDAPRQFQSMTSGGVTP
jgi:prepilin-type N-terminal cleavage/methylation domain-containing protein